MSWKALEGVRREFLKRLNAIRRDLESVDQTNEELRRTDIAALLGKPLGSRPREREFVRSLLLSGNGSLVFNNSFVQWGAAEALRRAQPQVLVAVFGVRPKIKPFSGSVLFEDQSRSNPVPDQDDPAGSLTDAQMLAQYVYYSAQRVNGYPGHTLTLMGAADLDRVLIVDAKPPAARLSGAELRQWAAAWVGA